MKKLFSSMMFVALAAMTFTACEDVPEPYDKPGTGSNAIGGNTGIEGGEGDGSLANPFNSVAALNYGNNLASGQSSADYMYIKGKVSSIKEEFTTNYGNGTFYISDDGTTTNQFYAYRVYYLGNKKFAASDDQIKVGDEVIVCGIITNYNGTIETAQNKGFLYSLNGVNRGGEPGGGGGGGGTSGDAKGSGTLEDPFNVAAAIAKCNEVGETGTSDNVYGKGLVKTIKKIDTSYGNAEFTIVDDMSSTAELTVYRAYGPGNQKITDANIIKEGDEVIICGKLVYFKSNTPEFTQGCYIYSINSTGGGDGGNPSGGDDDITPVDGTGTVSGNTLIINYDSFGFVPAEGQTNCPATASKLVDGTIVSFSKANGSTEPAYYTGSYPSVRVYANNTVKVKAEKNITKIEITTTDPSSSDKYNGSDGAYAEGDGTKVNINKVSDTNVVFDGLNAKEVLITNYNEANSKNQLRIKQMVITYAE